IYESKNYCQYHHTYPGHICMQLARPGPNNTSNSNHFDLTPKGMIKTLDLLRPIYRKSSYYGHFGRHEPEFTWEKTDKADAIRRDVKL
ncbi:MAG: methionine adenosyltransferase domain-containing protein, partial [Acidobacteria bacterium]|nr:methionine adenosyltransferase domain-containing protein [Acidobacteriota bacterium]